MDPARIQAMMAQAQEMARKLQEEMQSRTAEGSAGGGLVVATVSGHGDLVKLRIDPAALQGGDASLLEDLVVAAVHDAHARVKEMIQGELSRLTGGMGLPPLF